LNVDQTSKPCWPPENPSKTVLGIS
jgi:hypothetical protein